MSECIIWRGAVQSRGYGSVTDGHGGTINGPIPSGLTIDHLCRNKLCVNTEHMEVVTRAENSRRALAAQTHCKHGHPLSGGNLRLKIRRDGHTYRVCRACAAAIARRARLRASVEALLGERVA